MTVLHVNFTMYFCLCFGYHFLYLLYLHVRICTLSFCYLWITLLKGSSINQPQLAKKTKRKEKETAAVKAWNWYQRWAWKSGTQFFLGILQQENKHYFLRHLNFSGNFSSGTIKMLCEIQITVLRIQLKIYLQIVREWH